MEFYKFQYNEVHTYYKITYLITNLKDVQLSKDGHDLMLHKIHVCVLA